MGSTLGITSKQRKVRKEVCPVDGTPAIARHFEYFGSKMAIKLEMVRRARRDGVDFDYPP